MKAVKFLILILSFSLLSLNLSGCSVQQGDSKSFQVKKVYSIDFKEKIDSLDVVLDTSNGFIKINPTDKSTGCINIDYQIPASSAETAQKLVKENTQIEYQSGKLVISLEKFFDYFSKNKKYSWKNPFPKANITLYLPKNIIYNLECDTSNGEISVDKLKCSDVNLDTSNGEIVINNVKAQNIIADTSNGDIKFKAIAATTELDTSNGDIYLEAAPTNGVSNYKLDTSNGNINITIPERPDTGVKIDASTSVGKVSVSLGNFVISNEKDYREDQTELKGETKKFSRAKNKIIISADTSTGSINIDIIGK